MASRRKVKFSLSYKISLLIFSLILVTLAAIVGYYMTMNWNDSINEMKNSAKKAAKTLGALWPVAQGRSGVNWGIYENYMKQFVQIDKNIVFMAIIDEKEEVRAAAVNDALLKKKFPKLKLTEDKKETVKNLAGNKIDDTLKVREYKNKRQEHRACHPGDKIFQVRHVSLPEYYDFKYLDTGVFNTACGRSRRLGPCFYNHKEL